MKSKRQFKKFFYDPYWRVPYGLIIGGTKQQAYECACKLSGELPEQNFAKQSDATTFINDGLKNVVFWFRDYKLRPGLVAHEAVHAATAILRVSGVEKIDDSNDEVLAYYVQYLCEQIYKHAKQ